MQYLFAPGLLDGMIDKTTDHPQIYIRLEQSDLDLLYCVLDVFLGYAAFAGNLSEDIGKGPCQFVKHSLCCYPKA